MRETRERHEQWQGLAHCLEHGLIGYAPAPVREVTDKMIAQRQYQAKYMAKKKATLPMSDL